MKETLCPMSVSVITVDDAVFAPIVNKNLFDILEEKGYNLKRVAYYLKVKSYNMTVMNYIKRYQDGGLRHQYFRIIYDVCMEWCHKCGIDILKAA